MNQTIEVNDPEARKVRVLLALRLLSGDDIPVLDDEERWMLDEFRAARGFGYSRMEVVLVNHEIDGIHVTQHKKKKFLRNSLENT